MAEFTPELPHGAVLIELGASPPRFRSFRPLYNLQMLRNDSDFVAARNRVIRDYKAAEYTDYPVTLTDKHDLKSVHFVSRNRRGLVNGTVRICMDSELRLPAAHYAPNTYWQLKRQPQKIAEAGRFVSDGLAVCKRIVSAAYQFGKLMQVDLWMQVRDEHADFYKRHCGAKPTGGGTPSGCQNLIWRINKTPVEFYDTFGADQSELSRCWQNQEITHDFI
jgi:hypothetical protein